MQNFYNNYGYLSVSDFGNMTTANGFQKSDAIKFYQSQVDSQVTKTVTKRHGYNIEAQVGSYQMDLDFLYTTTSWLFIINMPSRKVWIHKRKSKSLKYLLIQFKKFFYHNQAETLENERLIASITSDWEAGFLWNTVLSKFIDERLLQYYVKDQDEHYI